MFTFTQNLPRHEKYPHIVNVEIANPTNVSEESLAGTKVNEPDKIDLEGIFTLLN